MGHERLDHARLELVALQEAAAVRRLELGDGPFEQRAEDRVPLAEVGDERA